MPYSRDFIAGAFLFETGIFDTMAEIRANPEHQLVRAAYKAADKIRAEQEREGHVDPEHN